MPEQQSQEDMEAMQEKLQNMSPEELKEFQKKNCIFCQIMDGKVNSKKIYEDDKCIAILDINPSNPGHVLLMPKEHYAIMPLIPEEIIKHIFMISKQISAALLRALQSQGTNIFVANGAAAGQKAQHFMVHVIPRMEKDGLEFNIEGKKANESDLEELRKRLVVKISQDLGGDLKEEEPEEKPKEEKEEPKEPEKDNKTKTTKKKETKPKTTEKKEEEKKEPPKKEEIDLDDIANLITGA
jgi:histidine triad (HIT) family protein